MVEALGATVATLVRIAIRTIGMESPVREMRVLTGREVTS